MKFFHSANLRKGRVSLPGQAYLVTAVTHQRSPRLAEFRAARICIAAMRHQEEVRRAQSLAFVVMPDHFHWLMILTSESLSMVMKSVKGFSAFRINHYQDCKGSSFWQRGFHDHAVREEEDLPAMARYLVANPIRRGLVESVWQYPHWDAVWVEG